MKYPCYKYNNQKEFDYIINQLKSFGYNISKDCIYCPLYEIIVINSANIFGKVDSITSDNIKNFNRYLVTDINEFLLVAAQFKHTIFKYNKTKNNMENNKPQTKEPQIGDKVFVKNIGDKDYVKRIYLGKYKYKYITVGFNTSRNFEECCNFGGAFWDEMVTRVTLTKTQIANKFGISVDILDIVD